MKLKVEIASRVPTLLASGEIYTYAGFEKEAPVVPKFVASAEHDYSFSLAKGVYIYQFAMEGATGALTAKIVNADTEDVLAMDDFDTKFGYYGNDLKFEVK